MSKVPVFMGSGCWNYVIKVPIFIGTSKLVSTYLHRVGYCPFYAFRTPLYL